MFRFDMNILKNLNNVVKIQRHIKQFLKKLKEKSKAKKYHRPNQSSIKLKSNRLSINNQNGNIKSLEKLDFTKAKNDNRKIYFK